MKNQQASGFSKLVVALCLGVVGMAAQALELRGFRGVAWGDDASSLGTAKLVHSQGELRCYRRERENMMFGDSQLKDVRYCFQQDRLFLVMIEADAAREDMVAEFKRTYGAPSQQSPAMVSWGGKSAGTHVEMLSAPGGRHTLLRIYSKDHAPLH